MFKIRIKTNQTNKFLSFFKNQDQSNDLVIDWNGRLNNLSHYVLTQFRVLYNISVLSESLM